MMKIHEFQNLIWNYYHTHKRTFAWRTTHDPYHIVVSEVMLQQTQTHRVVPKFEQFITAFPTLHHLAAAPFKDVLTCWQGLGYNRRCLALHTLAQEIMLNFQGSIPHDPAILVTLPAIGKNTAGSIAAFAFNKPTIFIETNIRTVFIHHFFPAHQAIHDRELLPLVEQALDHSNPREWYYALMDYGVMLKKNLPNPSRASAHHARQSKFEGSDRQIRGMILKLLTHHQQLSLPQLLALIEREPERIAKALGQLQQEKFITIRNNVVSIMA